MNYQAIIDFNKYTLALAAGGFAYVLNKYGQPEKEWIYWLVITILVLFLLSVIFGILVSSTATSRLNNVDAAKTDHDGMIKTFGITHIISLTLGMIILGVVVFSQLKVADGKDYNNTEKECCCKCHGDE